MAAKWFRAAPESPGCRMNGNSAQTTRWHPQCGTRWYNTRELEYDQLNVNGPAYLGGTLNLSLLPNLGQVCGRTFAIVNGNLVSGTFGTLNGLSQPGGMMLTLAYSGTSVTVTASKFAPAMVVAASADPSLLNQPVTFTVTVSPSAGATDTPNGTVQLQVDGINFGGPVTLSNAGQTSFSVSPLTVGSHTITALYSGDSCFNSSSASLVQVVQYRFGGFLPPLSTGVSYALGRTIPIKFQLSDYSGAAVTSPAAVTGLQIVPVNPSGAAFNPVSTDGKGLTLQRRTVPVQLADQGPGGRVVRDPTQPWPTAPRRRRPSSSRPGEARPACWPIRRGHRATATAGCAARRRPDRRRQSTRMVCSRPTSRRRISDAISRIDQVVAPYGVTITQVDPSSGTADVTIDTSSTSAVGGYADGVLGCESGTEVTLIQGWNWYAGTDPTAIQAGQFDFETVVMHELGHVLGLGHSADASSVMYATLGAGTANRNLTVADLNVPDTDAGASGLHAAVFRTPARLAPRRDSGTTINGLMAWDAALAEMTDSWGGLESNRTMIPMGLNGTATTGYRPAGRWPGQSRARLFT